MLLNSATFALAAAAIANAQSSGASASGAATGTVSAASAGITAAPSTADAMDCTYMASETTGTRSWPFCSCAGGYAGIMLHEGETDKAWCGQVTLSSTWGAFDLGGRYMAIKKVADQIQAEVNNTATDVPVFSTTDTAASWNTMSEPTATGTDTDTAAATATAPPYGNTGTSPDISGSTNGTDSGASGLRPANQQYVAVALAATLGFFAFYV